MTLSPGGIDRNRSRVIFFVSNIKISFVCLLVYKISVTFAFGYMFRSAIRSADNFASIRFVCLFVCLLVQS